MATEPMKVSRFFFIQSRARSNLAGAMSGLPLAIHVSEGIIFSEKIMPSDTWIASGKPDIAPAKFDLALDWIKKNRETFIGSVAILLAVSLFSVYFFIHYR